MTSESKTHVRLRYLRDRIVRLEEQRQRLAEDIKEIFGEAKSDGFDKAALRKVVKRSMMGAIKRSKEQATEEIADVYLANLGLLEGEPLNDAARRRADDARAKPKEDLPPGEPDGEEPSKPVDEEQSKPAGDPEGADDNEGAAPELRESSEEARTRGMADARAGLSVFKNPYVAGDPRRAFWDEGWCEEVGSDGMEVPEAWRRKSPSKPEQPGDDA